jgi:hypothetical protein
MVHHKVELGHRKRPSSLPAVKFLSRHEILEVPVISPDFHLVQCSFQEVPPLVQSSHDCQHLFIVDFVIPFGFRKRF